MILIRKKNFFYSFVILTAFFGLKYPRKVNKDNTISYQGRIYQLLPMNGIRSFVGSLVDVSESLDGQLNLLYKGKKVKYTILTKEVYKAIKEEEILSKRQYMPFEKIRRKYSPSSDHPWRKYWKLQYVTFQTGNKV